MVDFVLAVEVELVVAQAGQELAVLELVQLVYFLPLVGFVPVAVSGQPVDCSCTDRWRRRWSHWFSRRDDCRCTEWSGHWRWNPIWIGYDSGRCVVLFLTLEINMTWKEVGRSEVRFYKKQELSGCLGIILLVAAGVLFLISIA